MGEIAVKLKISIAAVLFILSLMVVSAQENSCIDCHRTLTPFTEEEKVFNEIRMRHISRGISCSLECHEDVMKRLATSAYKQWEESVHALNGVTCEKCHGGDPSAPNKDDAHAGIIDPSYPNSPLYYMNVPETCGKCHTQELINFKKSEHYFRLKGLALAPSCTTCHPAHSFGVRSPEEFRQFCSNCHSYEKGIAPYDIPLKADKLLSRANELKYGIQVLTEEIHKAELNGTDVTQAEEHLQKATSLLDSLPVKWHSFNLANFEGTLQEAKAELRAAERSLKPVTTPTPAQKAVEETPGFGIVSLLIAIALVYYTRRRG